MKIKNSLGTRLFKSPADSSELHDLYLMYFLMDALII